MRPMKAGVTIKNYRRFEDSHPLRFPVGDGISAFVGLNNSGKSSVLKFFYEFRNTFGILSARTGNLLAAMQHQPQGLNLLGVHDHQEVFCNLNDREITVEFEFAESEPADVPRITKAIILARRLDGTFTVDLWTNTGKVEGANNFEDSLLLGGQRQRLANLDTFFGLFSWLSRAFYIGPFRNALNTGAGQYFDISIGTAFIDTWHTWQTGPSKRQNDAIQSVVRNIQNIFGYRDLQIIAAKELNTLQVYADGKSYKLLELGGGIAQFIVVLGTAAIKDASLILIDEPELNLHPSLAVGLPHELGSLLRRSTSLRNALDRTGKVRLRTYLLSAGFIP